LNKQISKAFSSLFPKNLDRNARSVVATEAILRVVGFAAGVQIVKKTDLFSVPCTPSAVAKKKEKKTDSFSLNKTTI
jgi:hypothetical protein